MKKDGMFDTQVIISSELKDDDQIWLRALAPALKKTVLSSFLQKTAASFSQGQRDLMDSVLDVVLAANKESVTAMKGDELILCETLREIMADEIKESLEKSHAEGRVEGHAEGRIEGCYLQLWALVQDGTITIEKAAQKKNMTVQEFMEKLKGFGIMDSES